MVRSLKIILSKFYKLPLAILVIPLVFIVRLIKPFMVIRFGQLMSSRIGHFAANTELYLCAKDAAITKIRTLDIFYYNGAISNYQLKKMWDRILPISFLAKWVDKVNRLLPVAGDHIVPLSSDRDIYGFFEKTSAHLFFTDKEEDFGKRELQRLGIPVNKDSFVCFHGRDGSYLTKIHPEVNWDYHNHRDVNINNYILAAQELVRRGYFVLRMGATVKERLDMSHPKIVDYATSYRTDFMDIYLGGKCRFFIGDTAGIYAIPAIFRRPIVWVNYIPLEYLYSWNKDYLIIFKKLWLSREKRFLSFREIIDSGVGRFLNAWEYKQQGIEVIENSAEEIKDVVIEMDDRLKGKRQSTEEDECLQQRFWNLFKPSYLNKVFSSRIGAEFLRQNQDLLG